MKQITTIGLDLAKQVFQVREARSCTWRRQSNNLFSGGLTRAQAWQGRALYRAFELP